MSLTKKDWNGITVLLLLIALALAAPYAFKWFSKDSTINANELKAYLAQLNQTNRGNSFNGNDKPINVAHFKFNPNTLPKQQWIQLGLSEHQADVIKNYTAKGGKFYKAEDLKKIYGITADDYNRLAPYITIKADKNYKPKAEQVIEVNSADSAALTTVQGIGPAFATRIIYYRERLGGFIAKEQLKEVYGLDDIRFKQIKNYLKVDATRIRRLNINLITFDKLRLMPYLNYKQVNAIIEYRNQHGDYNTMADMKNIAIIDEQVLKKIEPYIIFK